MHSIHGSDYRKGMSIKTKQGRIQLEWFLALSDFNAKLFIGLLFFLNFYSVYLKAKLIFPHLNDNLMKMVYSSKGNLF